MKMFQERKSQADIQRAIAEYLAPGMFAVSLLFLFCQSVLVVILVDMPNFSEHAGAAMDPSSSTSSWLREIASTNGVELAIYDLSVRLIWILWPIVVAEAVFHWVTRPWDKQTRKLHLFSFLFCVCPSLRMCARSHEKGNRLWLPVLGWRYPNRRLRARLERHFSLPMIAIAFLILPVLVVEFFLHDQVEDSTVLWSLLHVGTGAIWLAFAIEFILMVSVAEKKIAYCKEHWLDLAILLLPLISFLRSVQFIRATNALRLPQLTKMLRVYRMRGTAVKALRGLIVLDLFSRFFQPDAEQVVEKLQQELREAEGKVRLIRRKLTKLEGELEKEKSLKQEQGSGGHRVVSEAVSAVAEPVCGEDHARSDSRGNDAESGETYAIEVNASGESVSAQKNRGKRLTTVVAPKPK